MKSKEIIYQNRQDTFPFFALEVKDGKMYPDSESFGMMHWHDEFQFIYVLTGKIEVKTLNQNFIVKAGQAIFINKTMIHLVVPIKGTHYVSFLFSEKLIVTCFSQVRFLMDELSQDQSKKILFINESSRQNLLMLEYLKELYSCKEPEQTLDYFRVQLLVANLCYQLFTIHINNEDYLFENPVMEQMLRHIAEHYHKKISLLDLSKSAHISVSMCQRQFRGLFESTPHQYINNYRLEKSKVLLRQHNLTIAEIAQEVGFSQSSHFSSLFKEKYGLTPKQYQKNR